MASRANLPHHYRNHPRIDERRSDPGDRRVLKTAAVVAYAVSMALLFLFAMGAV